MAMEYTLDFKEVKGGKSGFLNFPGPGIYCVYAGTYDKDNEKWSVRTLLYIGESGNVRDRFIEDAGDFRFNDLRWKHSYIKRWRDELKDAESLLYTVAAFESPKRWDAEGALIFSMSPVCNHERIRYSYSRFSKFHYPNAHYQITTKGDWYSIHPERKGMKIAEKHEIHEHGQVTTRPL